MAIMRHLRFKPHNLLRAWTILWLIAIPLFHIHPESDPHHGQAGHVHSGTVHTVFSGDLDGEFGHHRDKASSATVSHSGWFLSAEGPYDWKADPELGFSLLNDSSDRKLFKSLSTTILFIVDPIAPVPIRRDLLEQGGPSVLFPALFVSEIPARAPPSPLLM
jgi:hypothetical protein